MKKIFSLTLLISVLCCSLSAQRVTELQADQVCRRFLMDRGQTVPADLKLSEVFTQADGDTALYLFQLPEVGFVVVSASLTTPPVLAYAFDQNFEMIPPVRDLFYLYKGEIAYAEKQQWQAKPKAAAAWKRYLAEEFVPQAPKGTSGGPLLTTTWNQNKFYNTYCPWDPASGPYYDYRVPNGCVALACAQIMNYHRFPTEASVPPPTSRKAIPVRPFVSTSTPIIMTPCATLRKAMPTRSPSWPTISAWPSR